MRLFGALHAAALIATGCAAAVLALLCRRGQIPARATRLSLGYGLAIDELIWWAFRYAHEGWRFPVNLPLQLCDVTVWTTVAACLTLAPLLVEFSYFAGLAGSTMALLTPDLWSPCPSYPAIYFFVAHGGVVVSLATLVFGGIAPLLGGALWRAFALLLGYAAFLGAFNRAFGANYMYLCRKPANPSLLDLLGPWPLYLFAAIPIALALFSLLQLAANLADKRTQTCSGTTYGSR